jgi:hypothetical protein
MFSQNSDKITAKTMLSEIKSCNRGTLNLQETLQKIVQEIEIIKSKQGDVVGTGATSGDANIQEVCKELAPNKLIELFQKQDKRCFAVGISGHANNLFFMDWCRACLREFVYHTGVDMTGTRKKEILQKLARNMFRVMRSFDISSPFPDVAFIYERLDRKYTDWSRNERKRARNGNVIIIL